MTIAFMKLTAEGVDRCYFDGDHLSIDVWADCE